MYKILNQLNFIIKGQDEHNDKNLKVSFKSGQDFEYVKYKISTLLEVDQESIVQKYNIETTFK